MMINAIAKQRSARLHFFQSEIKSRIHQPPAAIGVIDNRRAWSKFGRTMSLS
jgi:hypothetical protein